MATTIKKGSKNKGVKVRHVVKTSEAKQAQTIAELGRELEARNRDLAASLQREEATAKELQDCKRQLTEGLEQQTATGEVLRVIAGSPIDLQPVYETILQNVTRLCEANIAVLFLYDGEVLKTVAHHGTTSAFAQLLEGRGRRPGRETPSRLAALERNVLHVSDLLSDPVFSPEPLEVYQKENMRVLGWNAFLTPFLN